MQAMWCVPIVQGSHQLAYSSPAPLLPADRIGVAAQTQQVVDVESSQNFMSSHCERQEQLMGLPSVVVEEDGEDDEYEEDDEDDAETDEEDEDDEDEEEE